MIKQLALMDVLKDSPTRDQLLREFATRHSIEVWYTKGIPEPWCACHMPSARKFGYGVTESSDLFDCISKVGRLLDEADVFVTGTSKRKTIEKLCRLNNLPMP